MRIKSSRIKIAVIAGVVATVVIIAAFAAIVLNSNHNATSNNANPYIVSVAPTSTADLAANIVITFNKSMNIASVTYTIAPDPGGLAPTWNSPTNTILTITHMPFALNTRYTVTVVAGTDAEGGALVAGDAPNPWSFTSTNAMAPVGSWNHVAALTATKAELTFGASTKAIMPTDIELILRSNGMTVATFSFSAVPSASTTNMTSDTAGKWCDYYDYNYAGNQINSGDYFTISGLATKTSYTSEVYYIRTGAMISMTGATPTWTQP